MPSQVSGQDSMYAPAEVISNAIHIGFAGMSACIEDIALMPLFKQLAMDRLDDVPSASVC